MSRGSVHLPTKASVVLPKIGTWRLINLFIGTRLCVLVPDILYAAQDSRDLVDVVHILPICPRYSVVPHSRKPGDFDMSSDLVYVAEETAHKGLPMRGAVACWGRLRVGGGNLRRSV
jgi:hypothetical protein